MRETSQLWKDRTDLFESVAGSALNFKPSDQLASVIDVSRAAASEQQEFQIGPDLS
jgi:hypothetical protein